MVFGVGWLTYYTPYNCTLQWFLVTTCLRNVRDLSVQFNVIATYPPTYTIFSLVDVSSLMTSAMHTSLLLMR